MDIGKHLKEVRVKQNISMNSLAKSSNIAQSTLSYIESGKQQPSIDILERILIALGTSLCEFFADKPPSLSPEVQMLVNATKNLSKAEIQKLTEFIELRKEN